MYYCRLLMPETRKDERIQRLLDYAGKSTINSCLNTIIWSLGIVSIYKHIIIHISIVNGWYW